MVVCVEPAYRYKISVGPGAGVLYMHYDKEVYAEGAWRQESRMSVPLSLASARELLEELGQILGGSPQDEEPRELSRVAVVQVKRGRTPLIAVHPKWGMRVVVTLPQARALYDALAQTLGKAE